MKISYPTRLENILNDLASITEPDLMDLVRSDDYVLIQHMVVAIIMF
jgi:hypothetical protein